MSKPVLQLQNGANWSALWNYSVLAASAPGNSGSTLEIPAFECPFLLENHIIAISAFSQTAKPSWNLAANIAKKISTGILVGGTADVSISDSRRLYLNKINLFRFTPLTATYVLEIAPKYWITQLSVTLWIYTGVDTDTTSAQLDRIELAVDNINR